MIAVPTIMTLSRNSGISRIRKRSITLDQPASDLTDFPVLIYGTYDYLKTRANGGKVNDLNGYDITFYSDSDLTTLLDFERVYWNGATGLVEFWVKIPTLTSASATVIYMSYGDPSITTDQQDAAGTWDSSFKSVYHLPDGASFLSLLDSKGVANGTPGAGGSSPTPVAGQIDGGANFIESSFQFASSACDLSASPLVTVEFWLYQASFLNRLMLELTPTAATNDGAFNFQPGNISPDGFAISARGGGVVTYKVFTRPGTGWRHYMTTFDFSDGTNIVKNFWIDGVAQTLTSSQNGVSSGNAANNTLYWMCRNAASSFNTGILDELRISGGINRSGDYVAACFSNQNDPANFYTIGNET